MNRTGCNKIALISYGVELRVAVALLPHAGFLQGL